MRLLGVVDLGSVARLHASRMNWLLSRRDLFLNLRFIDELILRLRHYVQSVRLVLLVLVHLFAPDVRALFEHDPHQALEPKHVSLIERHKLPLVEAVG